MNPAAVAPIPAAQPVIGVTMTNADFLQAIFGKAGGYLWTCSFPEPPDDADGTAWAGSAYQSGEPLVLPETHNNYFSVAELSAPRRIKDNFLRMGVLALDDVDTSALCLPLSYVIETSPGNYQGGYILNDTPEARDSDYCTAALKALSARGLVHADKSGNNAVRYVRLPRGSNTKPRETGDFQCVLKVWEPTRRYDLPDVLAALGITALPSSSPRPGASQRADGKLDVQGAIAEILAADNFHENLNRLAAHYIATGVSVRDTEAMLYAFIDASPAKTSAPARWEARRDDIPRAVKTAAEKFGNMDFETLKAAAEKLSKASASDEINTILRGCGALGAIDRRRIQEIIKRQTALSYGEQKKALAELAAAEIPDHLTLARAVLQKTGAENILATASHPWQWDKRGRWRAIPDRELKQLVQRNLEEDETGIMRALVDAVADVLKTDIFKAAHEWNRAQDVINLPNGELHWNIFEWELLPHCRERYLTTQLPVSYLPDAPCPRFRQFLREIFEGDADAELKAQAILEMIGYTLTCDTRFERFVLLIGGGANGKSVLMEVIRLLVGRDNATAVQPSQFNNKFQRAHLHLKLANLVTEIAEGAEIADAELKAIVSGELMTAEEKFLPPFDFRPYATCWFGTNHMPHTRDFSDALFRRALIVPFNRTFKAGEGADPHLKEKLGEELPGILNLVLEAYGDVLLRGHFTEPPSCLRAKADWRVEADQAAQFLEDECELATDAVTASSTLYFAYTQWARRAGITRCLNQKNFTIRIVRYGARAYKGAGGARMIAGVRLKSMAGGGAS